jgi:hypothetical protein
MLNPCDKQKGMQRLATYGPCLQTALSYSLIGQTDIYTNNTRAVFIQHLNSVKNVTQMTRSKIPRKLKEEV